MTAKTARVVFTPSGRRGAFAIGTPVLEAAQSLGVDVDTVCGGRGLCGRCQVTCSEGEFAKHQVVSSADNLTAFSEVGAGDPTQVAPETADSPDTSDGGSGTTAQEPGSDAVGAR